MSNDEFHAMLGLERVAQVDDALRKRVDSDLIEPVVKRPGEDGLLRVEEAKRSSSFPLEQLLDLCRHDDRRTVEHSGRALTQPASELRSVFVADCAASPADVEGDRHAPSLTWRSRPDSRRF